MLIFNIRKVFLKNFILLAQSITEKTVTIIP